MTANETLLTVDNISVRYQGRGRKKVEPSVDRVSFEVALGETVALVGESGSGKTSIGNAILGLVPFEGGSVAFEGASIVGPKGFDRARVSKSIQVIFQDPYGSLNPGRTIGQILVEPLIVHRKQSKREMALEVEQMLARVGLPPEAAQRYPRSFSGGQRQRIAIARAMMIEPKLVVCDEPVSALDLSVQAQILNLLGELQETAGLSYIFITHDVAVVRHVAHQVVVLFRGRIVEKGTVDQVCDNPRHPYTRALFLAAPVADPAVQKERSRDRRELGGSQKLVEPTITGCPYLSRCSYAIERCALERPELRTTRSGSLSACHRDDELPDMDFNSLWPRLD